MVPGRLWSFALALILGLGGCDNLFNLQKIGAYTGDGRLDDSDDSTTLDSFQPKDCSAVRFPNSTPVELPELKPFVAGDPAMSDDQLELFFVHSSITPYEIWRAKRSTTIDGFSIATAKESFNIGGLDNVDPSITADGKLLVFVVRTGSGDFIYSTERSAVGSWSSAVAFPGLDNISVESAQITWDGLGLYFTRLSDGHLFRATRSSRTATFGVAEEISSTPLSFGTESSDGLELYTDYLSGGIGRSVRGSLAFHFPADSQEFTFGKDPQLSMDSTRLVISYDTTIAVLQRTCP